MMTPVSPKKLLYVLNYVHADDAQHFVHVFSLLDALAERGWDIEVVSEKGGRGVCEVFGWPVRYLSDAGHWVRGLRLLRAMLAARRSGCKLVFVRISRPPAVVAGLAARLMGARSVMWHSSATFDLDRARPPLKRWGNDVLTQAAFRLSHRLVTGPETMVEYYAQTYGLPRRKLTLLYNDIDPERFSPPKRAVGPADPARVLFVHSFSPSRNTVFYVPSIIAALNARAAAGRRSEWVVIGDGAERKIVEDQARAASDGVTVRFLGKIANRKIMEHYAAADVFIMPSYREGMPRVLLEAMAMGLPFVATDAGGTRDIVGPGQLPYVVARDDADGFAARLVSLLDDPNARARLAAENLEHVKRYATQAVADMYDEALSAINEGRA